MLGSKFCVFCGNVPESKNREHVLPQWLLSLTGDPKRVVNFGVDYRTGKTVRFAWQSLVMPACEACNTEFSKLEFNVRPIIEKILDRAEVSVSQYGVLLDWLDKVRVGLWLNYHVLQGNPMAIDPSFYIKSRLRQKDRFLAVYPIAENSKGLNAHGVETLAFHREPSAFCLRINNVHIVNCSSDYLFSSRCGFPYPTNVRFNIDGENRGRIQLGDFKATKKVKSPIFRFSLFKPSVYLFQPIVQVGVDMGDGTGGLEFDGGVVEYLKENTDVETGFKVGRIFRQYQDRVLKLDDVSVMVDFDEVKGADCVSVARIVAQVYELQLYLRTLCVPLADSQQERSDWEAGEKLIRLECKRKIKSCLSSRS